MGLITKQDIDNFYTNYKNEEVVFTKTISSLFGLQPKHIYMKFKEIQRPCIIYSSSMAQAKVIASLTNELKSKIENESSVNLRFAMANEEKKNDSLFFFIKCRTTDITPYKPELNLYIINFSYVSKPPEALVIMLGRLLEAKSNSSTRVDERIIIDKGNFDRIGLLTTSVKLTIDNIPRQAIVRDISFGGAKFLLAGNAKFLKDKAVKVILEHREYGSLVLLGKSIRAETMANRKDIVALAIQFDIKQISVQYSMMINEYLKTQKFTNKQKTEIENR